MQPSGYDLDPRQTLPHKTLRKRTATDVSCAKEQDPGNAAGPRDLLQQCAMVAEQDSLLLPDAEPTAEKADLVGDCERQNAHGCSQIMPVEVVPALPAGERAQQLQ